MAAKSSYLINAILNAVRNTAYTSPTTVYAALFNGNPTSGGTEISGGSYARQSVGFAAPSGGSVASNTAQTFSGMPNTSSTPINYVALYDASTGGNLLYYASVTSITTNSGDTVSIASGNITVSES